jgi:hypothetical protein
MVPNAAEMAVIGRMKAMRQGGATYRAIGAVLGHGPKSVQRILERMERTRHAAGLTPWPPAIPGPRRFRLAGSCLTCRAAGHIGSRPSDD